jgi:hypothetical protein
VLQIGLPGFQSFENFTRLHGAIVGKNIAGTIPNIQTFLAGENDLPLGFGNEVK